MKVTLLRLLLGRWFLIGTLAGSLRIWRKRRTPPIVPHDWER